MPLLQSLEDDRVKKLKSLKYPSGQAPYVQKDILDPPTYNAFSAPITKRLDDVERIAKMLTDVPGIKFAANQTLLQQTDIVGDALKGKTAASLKDGLRGTAAVLGSIIKQVPVNGTGTHFYQVPESARYAGVEGATLARYAGVIPVPFDQMSNLTTTKEDGTVVKSDYSIYGPDTPLVPSSLTREESLGAIEYDRTSSKPFAFAQASGSNLDLFRTKTNPVAASSDYYAEQGEVEVGKQPEGKKKEITIQSSRYKDRSINKETRVGLGNQANKEADLINLLDVGRGELPAGATEPTQEVDFVGRDLIKFRFYVDGTPLYFRAHLTTFTDNHTGNWNPHQYIGRADQFYTYQGYSRGVNIGFSVAAASKQELKPLYRKLNYLASACTPKYEGTNFMQGTVARVTVGNYLYRTPGVINSVGIAWQSDYPWEIALNEPERGDDTGMLELPMILNASINFNVIHDFTPEVGKPFFAKEYVNNTL